MDITGDNICNKKKKSPAYIVAVAAYIYLYFLLCVCYSYLYVNLCFKYKDKVIKVWRLISIFLVAIYLHIIYVLQILSNLHFQTFFYCYFEIGL